MLQDFTNSLVYICFMIIYVQLDPENAEALVALAITDLHKNEGQLCQQILFSLCQILIWSAH